MRRTPLLLVCILLVSAQLTRADTLTPFTSRALFGGNDSAAWGPSGGPDNASLGNSFAITSSGGLGITASQPAGGQLTTPDPAASVVEG